MIVIIAVTNGDCCKPATGTWPFAKEYLNYHGSILPMPPLPIHFFWCGVRGLLLRTPAETSFEVDSCFSARCRPKEGRLEWKGVVVDWW